MIYTTDTIDFKAFVPKFDKILERGLCKGQGTRKQMCVEAAVCVALDLPFGDEPSCVTKEIRNIKIAINDLNWSSSTARAKGLRNLGIAQVGSKGVVDGKEFKTKLKEKIVKVLIPSLLRENNPYNKQKQQKKLEIAQMLENATNISEALTKAFVMSNWTCVYSSNDFSNSLFHCSVNALHSCLCDINHGYMNLVLNTSHTINDKYLLLSCDVVLDVLKELKSPGCEWL